MNELTENVVTNNRNVTFAYRGGLMQQSISIAAGLWLVLIISNANAQTKSIQLPQPGGPSSIGTTTFEWTDPTRTYHRSTEEKENRRIAVQIWYPAKLDNQKKASYSANSKEFKNVTTNSWVNPPFAEGVTKCPLILISPGRGVWHIAYSALAESLASHNYVVAAVGMPDIGNIKFSDGYHARPDARFQPNRELMSGPYEKVDKFFEAPTELGLQDLEFALTKLQQLNDEDPNKVFTGKLDLTRIGVFGHSLGGRIAGALAVKNENVKAYISMEGIAPRRARFEGLLQMPVAMMCSSGTLPYAKENYQTLIDGRTEQVFMIELQKFGHNSVTDLPLINPDRFKYEIEPKLGLLTSVKVIERFFDSHLKRGSSFGESLKGLDNVIVTEFSRKSK